MSLQQQINKVKEDNLSWKSNSRIIGRAAEIYSCQKIKCIKCNEMNWLECDINAKSKDEICKKCGKKYQIKCKNTTKKLYNNIKKIMNLKPLVRNITLHYTFLHFKRRFCLKCKL